ncbi:TPA: hypothetical protein ACNVDX_003405 [Citrobacter gillenii]
MKLTRRELEIVEAITMQYRMKHTGAGKRDVMAVFHRARAAVLEARMDKGATVAPSFTWRKSVQLRRKHAD